jgi:hypothetical protein
MSLVLQSSGGGQITIQEPATASNFTQTLPAATGTVMVSGNMPAFRATQTTGTSIPNTTFTKILFDTVTFDTNSNFASSRFLPTVAGYYQVTGIVRFSAVSGNFISPYIYKNGSGYQGMEGCVQSASNDLSGIVSSLVFCNGSTDFIEFYVFQSSGGSKTTIAGTVNTSFSCAMVRAA